MKKLIKLQINSDKIMKNDELTALRGGYDGGCSCDCYTWEGQLVQTLRWPDALECNPVCLMAIGHGYGYYHC